MKRIGRRGKIGIITLAAVVVILAAAAWIASIPPEISRQAETELAKRIGANRVSFQQRSGKVETSLQEVNGWLLLEAVLLKKQNKKLGPDLEEALKGWPPAKLAGWWPEKTRIRGQSYFVDEPPIQLPEDLDDSIWRFDLSGTQPTVAQLGQFIGKGNVTTRLVHLCKRYQCNEDLILRTWALLEWQEDIDLVSLANAVSYLQIDDSKMNLVISETKKLINTLIRANVDQEYYPYYEPKTAGAALMLFYHYARRPYLDKDAEKILLERYAKEREIFRNGILMSRWGGDRAEEDDWYHGYNFVYSNDRLPALLVETLDPLLPKVP